MLSKDATTYRSMCNTCKSIDMRAFREEHLGWCCENLDHTIQRSVDAMKPLPTPLTSHELLRIHYAATREHKEEEEDEEEEDEEDEGEEEDGTSAIPSFVEWVTQFNEELANDPTFPEDEDEVPEALQERYQEFCDDIVEKKRRKRDAQTIHALCSDDNLSDDEARTFKRIIKFDKKLSRVASVRFGSLKRSGSGSKRSGSDSKRSGSVSKRSGSGSKRSLSSDVVMQRRIMQRRNDILFSVCVLV